MPDRTSDTTVYYDGSCPLCATEIRHYRNQDSDGRLEFVDVSKDDAALPAELTRQQAMARFHVLSADGGLLSGARAFAAVWKALPKWRWAAVLAGVPGVMQVLEIGYSLSLRIRPAVSGLLSRKRQAGPVNSAQEW